jgi:hypothetical protein
MVGVGDSPHISSQQANHVSALRFLLLLASTTLLAFFFVACSAGSGIGDGNGFNDSSCSYDASSDCTGLSRTDTRTHRPAGQAAQIDEQRPGSASDHDGERASTAETVIQVQSANKKAGRMSGLSQSKKRLRYRPQLPRQKMIRRPGAGD